jgi:hypothetical protein
MRRRWWILSVPFVALLAVACGRNIYQPLYCPNRSDLTSYTRGLLCDTEARARCWLRQHAAERRDAEWDQEIGKNCQAQRDTDLLICDDTSK